MPLLWTMSPLVPTRHPIVGSGTSRETPTGGLPTPVYNLLDNGTENSCTTRSTPPSTNAGGQCPPTGAKTAESRPMPGQVTAKQMTDDRRQIDDALLVSQRPPRQRQNRSPGSVNTTFTCRPARSVTRDLCFLLCTIPCVEHSPASSFRMDAAVL